jgi:hypothetical protein
LTYSESSNLLGEKRKKKQRRKYDTNYIKWGFTCTEDGLQPFCVIFNESLSNQSMKPDFLRRHLNSKHGDLASKPTHFFLENTREETKRQTQFQKVLTVSSKCVKASYALSLLVAKCKKPHNIAEELIIPCAVEISSVVLDEKTVSLIKAIPSSDNTIQRKFMT